MQVIKTREVIRDVKVKESMNNLKYYVRDSVLHTKDMYTGNQQEAIAPNAGAVGKVQKSSGWATARSAERIKDAADTIRLIHRKKSNPKISQANPQNILKTSVGSSTIQLDGGFNAARPFIRRTPYSERMRRHVIQKYIKSIENKMNSRLIGRAGVQFFRSFTKAVQIAKTALINVNLLLSAGSGLIVLLTMTLFIGALSSFSVNNMVVPSVVNLSEEVLAYKPVIESVAKDYGMEDYVVIIMAVMMQESGGTGTDPMQCSESPYNTKYSHAPNSIKDSKYSIEVGIQTLSACFKEAGVTDVNDTEKINLALQGYNYGNGYISWALENFGGYTESNAQLFSDMMKSKKGWSGYGDPLYVEHVLRYVSFGFGDIRSSPNFDNLEAWVTANPYAQAGLYGQCTWFAWGRFYEIYGYSPGFTGNGWDCVDELIAAHPDQFTKSGTPEAGAIFSGVGMNHVGIVVAWDGTYVTVQEGNLDVYTNTFSEAKTDWWEQTYTLSHLNSIYGGVVFAVHK